MDYFKSRFIEIGNKLITNEDKYDYTSMTKPKFDEVKKYLPPNIKYVHMNNILVGETVHSQYIYNTQNPTKLVNDINSKIEKLKKTLDDLQSAKEQIINDCSDVVIKRDLLLDNYLTKS